MSDADQHSSGQIQKILSVAEYAGSSVVGPMVKSYIRDETVSILNEHEPASLKKYILVDYPIVERETPGYVRQGLATVGPRYEEQIRDMLTTENVIEWMENPDEHLDVDEETGEQVRECARIVKETDGGRDWLDRQVYAVYEMCGIV